MRPELGLSLGLFCRTLYPAEVASLPEDDGPTMIGAPGEQRVAPRLPTGHDGEAPADDTTSALLGPPAAPPAPEPVGELSDDDLDSDDEDEPEEHTVQQAMPPSVAAAAARARQRSRRADQAVEPARARHRRRPAREAAKTDATDLTDDDEPLEDSITATAPRLRRGEPHGGRAVGARRSRVDPRPRRDPHASTTTTTTTRATRPRFARCQVMVRSRSRPHCVAARRFRLRGPRRGGRPSSRPSSRPSPSPSPTAAPTTTA